MMLPEEADARAVLAQLRVPTSRLEEPGVCEAVGEVLQALARFAELLPAAERPAGPRDLVPYLASGNALDPLRRERRLPVTLILYSAVHPGYYEGEGRIGEPAWRLCYTDGGAVGPSPARARLLDEVIRLGEAMHDKNPFGEVPFDGGKTVLVQEGPHFQAVTALYGDVGMSLFILAKGGVRYYSNGPVSDVQKKEALDRWAASSVLAGVLAQKYIAGPDMRMGDAEVGWIDAAAAEVGTARRLRLHPAVTGLPADAGGFPHQAWELTGRTVSASLKEALRHPGMAHYGLSPQTPLGVLIQGFGDVGGSVARLLTEESPDFAFRITGVADEFGAVYRAAGLDVPGLLSLRAARRPVPSYAGPLDLLWVSNPTDADRARPEFRGSDGREWFVQEAAVFIPAAVPNVVDAALVPRLKVKLIAEGANNAVVPHVEEVLHPHGILYLPGQALNWGGVKSSTLEALFRELTKRRTPLADIEQRVSQALAPLGAGVDLGWALELLRSGMPGPPLGLEETRAFAISILEDLARANTRWLMGELVASRYTQPPLETVKRLSRTIRALKVQFLSLIEQGLGLEFFAPTTSLQRLTTLLDERLKELLSDAASNGLTGTQVVEQRQLLQQLQTDVRTGLSPVFAALLAALDLARQKVMDPDGYSQEGLQHTLAVLRRRDAPLQDLEDSLYRVQRVHPGLNRFGFVQALVNLVQDHNHPPVVRRNAALALAKLGSAEPTHRTVLLAALADPDLTVRAACRWALHQMAIEPPDAPEG